MRVLKYIAFGVASLLIPLIYILLFLELEEKEDALTPVVVTPTDLTPLTVKIDKLQSDVDKLSSKVELALGASKSIDVNLPKLPDIKVDATIAAPSPAPHISKEVLRGVRAELEQLSGCDLCSQKRLDNLRETISNFPNSNLSLIGLEQDCKVFMRLKRETNALLTNAITVTGPGATSAGADFSILHGRLMRAVREFNFQCTVLNDEIERVRVIITTEIEEPNIQQYLLSSIQSCCGS